VDRATWGTLNLREVKAVQVESWLASLTMANGTKAKIRNILCSLFRHACRWELADRNPITHVRQATQRAKQPVILSNDEITPLLDELQEPACIAVYVALATGLRVSELLALQREGIDFSNSAGKLALDDAVPEAVRLGIPQPEDGRQATLLARLDDEEDHLARCEASRDPASGSDGTPSGVRWLPCW
jgi:hypothetical protein